MARRSKYKEKVARLLYERTSLNKTIFTMQKSWKEADKTLGTLEKQFQQKILRKEEKGEEKKD